ncbi:MAG: LCP family protein [Clostridiales bacterium]|nr:LCP family protein [Clostridiales bacterium]
MKSSSYSGAARPRKRTGADHFGLFTLFLLLAASLALYIRLMATGMLSNLYLIILMMVLIVLNAVSVIVQLPLRRNKAGKLIMGIVSLLLSGAMLYGVVAVNSVQSALSKIVGKMTETEITEVRVMNDNPATSMGDTKGYTFGYIADADTKNTQSILDEISKSFGTIKSKGYDSMTALADALYDDEVDAILINQGYVDLLTEKDGYTDFRDQTRVLYTYTTTHEVDPIVPNTSITKEPFVVYCSGIDARVDDISAKSRSDVNILAVVNPTTKQILLVNTPRDYYLPLARNGELDKLTHAGLYGIDESMKVLGNLYGVQADYYVRVNFAGLVKIVDALGGVDIESDANFTCVPMETPDGNGDYTYQKYSFTKGINHVNGSQALAFARERKAFADGDNRRGQHQMTVIKAIVNKACSSAVLTKYQELLKAASDAFITNMPYADISSLVQMQLGDMADWNITTYAVSGEGSTEYCYALGDKAWVMIKDSSKVNTAKNMIQQVINGEVPTTSSSDSN